VLRNPDKYERRFKGLKPQSAAEEKSAKRKQFWDLTREQQQELAKALVKETVFNPPEVNDKVLEAAVVWCGHGALSCADTPGQSALGGRVRLGLER
jgi:hypothetical protein